MPPLDLIPALVGSIVGAVVDAPAQPPPPPIVSPLPRAISPLARLGEMQPPVDNTVVINGKLLTLAPAAQIRDTNNLIVLPAYVQRPVNVRFLVDASGAVFRVWILTPDEAAGAAAADKAAAAAIAAAAAANAAASSSETSR
ncbi:hypothetical protein [Rhodocyclus tenuis]|uniref:hypothetical protein n=1 Tax=Rhodocyclus tenuis TaxID=1066 RepID=UPI0019059C6E|nr:hypothetical protein [Rhodocyclus tenuis]MBK1681336.1 hypothetical protein [Rhodocyclus tenuis]